MSNTYRRANLPKYAKLQREWRRRNPKKVLVLAARSRAKRNGLPFDITVESLKWPERCPILGIVLDYTRTPTGSRRLRSNFPTLDRRRNDLGYVVGNVFVISHRANRLKSDASPAELEALLAYTKA